MVSLKGLPAVDLVPLVVSKKGKGHPQRDMNKLSKFHWILPLDCNSFISHGWRDGNVSLSVSQ